MNKTEQMTPEHPLDDYLAALLEQDVSDSRSSLHWDNLLESAVHPHRLEQALSSGTLAPGYAPVILQRPGNGSAAQRYTQQLHLLRYASVLPASRLRQCLLDSCSALQYREAGYG